MIYSQKFIKRIYKFYVKRTKDYGVLSDYSNAPSLLANHFSNCLNVTNTLKSNIQYVIRAISLDSINELLEFSLLEGVKCKY